MGGRRRENSLRRRGRQTHRDDLARLPVRIDLRALSLAEGVRAGLAVAVLVAAHAVLHAPILLEAGLGALLTCLGDAGGPLRRRAPALLAFAALGGALIVGLGLLRPIGAPLIPLAALGIFVFGFVRIYGPAAQQVGTLLSVVLVLALDHGFASPAAALRVGGAFMGGSLWAVLLTMVIWRLHPNRPVRLAVAQVYLALAALAADLPGLPAGDAAAPAWERHARARRRAVREALEEAHAVLAERVRSHLAMGDTAARAVLRLDAADQIFAAVIALGDLLESRPEPPIQAAAAALAHQAAVVLRDLAPYIVEDGGQKRDGRAARLAAAIGAIEAPALGLSPHGRPEGRPEGRSGPIAALLVERLRGSLDPTGGHGRLPPRMAPERWDAALMRTLRDNLTWRSVALRHAARAASVAACGLAITFAWPASYQHWLTITLVLTLQPYYAVTLQRAIERIGGTVAGGLVAAGLGLVCRTNLAMAAAILPLSVLALAVRRVNFGLYMAALTPLVVLLVELGRPEQSEITVALMRGVYTVTGGMLAVLGCVVLWPSWEPDRLEQERDAAVRAHMRFAMLELGLLAGQESPEAVDAARREAGLASNNLEASISRALLEPGRAGRAGLEAAMVVDAALRRIAGRIAALRLDAGLHRPGRHDASVLAAWREWIGRAGTGGARPALPADETLREGLLLVAAQLELCWG